MFETVGYMKKRMLPPQNAEGRIAILVDGVPLHNRLTFVQNFQTSEDYNTRFLYASVTRLMRFVAYFLGVHRSRIIAQQPSIRSFTRNPAVHCKRKKGTPFPCSLRRL